MAGLCRHYRTMSSFLYYILPALGGYTLTSLYLLKNPLVLHKKKCTAFYCTHISHRGGKGRAWRQGYRVDVTQLRVKMRHTSASLLMRCR